MQVRQILVPIDFSDHSMKALRTATELGGTFGAKLVLLHALHLGIFFGGAEEPVVPPQDFFETLRTGASQRLEKLAQDVRAKGVPVEVRVSEAPAVEAILAAAREPGIDLIVMSTHGLTGLKHLLLGSVAERILQLAPCPVLSVKREED